MNATAPTQPIPARWTVPAISLGEEHELMREDLCADVYNATHMAIGHGGMILAKTPLGLCIMKVRDHDGARLIWFDHSSNNGWARRVFWYNASSVRELGNLLRRLPRVPFERLMNGEVE